jgi:ectoine hydroxylase-related dioxygenase (phytanoyl-CoA dioxygenase family)
MMRPLVVPPSTGPPALAALPSPGSTTPETLVDALERDGFAIVPVLVDLDTISRLREAVHRVEADAAVRTRGGGTYAVRDLFRLAPEVRAPADSAAVREVVEAVLRRDAFPVNALLFNKLPEANWKIPWHQDLFIRVRERREAPGFTGWSVRAGVPHVHPPVPVLEGILTLRLHLDDCGPENGALQVLPGSHRSGRLEGEPFQEWRERVEPVTCACPAGGAVLMRPLLLHRSAPASRPSQRRVIHLEYAAEALPGGLQWVGSAEGDLPAEPPERRSQGSQPGSNPV